MFYKGEWGTVCNNGWNFPRGKNLDVVCRELGFAQGREINTRYPGTGTTWLDGVTCSGDEESMVNCPHKSWADTNCPHSQDVSVDCKWTMRDVLGLLYTVEALLTHNGNGKTAMEISKL